MNIKRKIVICISFILSAGFIYICLMFIRYNVDLKNGYNLANEPQSNNQTSSYYDDNLDIKSRYSRIYQLILPKILVNDSRDCKGEELKFIYIPQNYIVPDIILEKSDIMLSYGVHNDMSAERIYTEKYKKPSYSFDCGVDKIALPNALCSFESECIGTDEFILSKELGQISSGKIHSLGEKLTELHAENKKIFLKMDIAGAESTVIPDIVKYARQITGISIAIHLDTDRNIADILKVIDDFDKDFVLVARANHWITPSSGKKCKYTQGEISSTIVLTYINKNLLKRWFISNKQDDIKLENDLYKQFEEAIIIPEKLNPAEINNRLKQVPHFSISEIVIVNEKIKKLRKIIKNQIIPRNKTLRQIEQEGMKKEKL